MQDAPFARHGVTMHFLGRLFLEGPRGAGLVEAFVDDLFAMWPVMPHGPRTEEALARLHALSSAAEIATLGGQTALADALERDHARLFIGPEIAVPPWESVWRDKERLLFGEQTFAVREAYARSGLAVERKDTEPDDHIGYELLFLAQLAAALTTASSQHDATLDAARAFLDDHLLRWLPDLCEAITRSAATPHYAALALLTAGAVADLQEEIDGVLTAS